LLEVRLWYVRMSSSFKRRGKEKAAVRPDATASTARRAPSSPSSFPSSATTAASELKFSDNGTVSFSAHHPIHHPILDPRRQGNPTHAPPPQPAPTVAAPHRPLPGTRPWTSNLTVTSFGLREVDTLLFSAGGRDAGGGGQPLRTLTVLEEDRLSDDLSRALCRCWCAEGVAQRQLVLLAGTAASLEGAGLDDGLVSDLGGSTPEELEDFVRSLPRDLHLDKSREQARQGGDGKDSHHGNAHNRESISAIAEEEGDEEDRDQDRATTSEDEGLVNAWQYRKSVQGQRSGINSGARDSSPIYLF